LHELLQQWPLWTLTGGSGSDSERDFGKWLFDQFFDCFELIESNSQSLILIAELYHRKFWSRDILEKAQEWQKEICGHADPPAAFPDPSNIVEGALEGGKFAFEWFDEDFSIPEGHKFFKKLDEKKVEEEVKSHFRNRPFACLVFRFLGVRSNAHERRSFGKLISDPVGKDIKLSQALKTFDNALGNWVSNPSAKVEDKYNEVFVGRNPSDPSIAEPGVFRALERASVKLTSNFTEYMKTLPRQLHTFWFSVNSLILPGRDGRYLPSKEERDLSFSTVKNPEDNDWATIGYNHLLSFSNVNEMFLQIPLLEKPYVPSLYEWLVGHRSSSPQEPPKSVTIAYAEPNKKQQVEEAIRGAETPDGASLAYWSEIKDIVRDKHLLALIPFGKKDDEFKIGPYVNKLTDYGYCGNPTEKGDPGIAARVMESIASVLLDFQFLRRFVDFHEGKKDEKELAQEALDKFENRWLRKEHFFSNEESLRELARKAASVMLPLPYKECIESACEAARKLLRKESGATLPRVWTTLSPSRDEGEAPWNVMFLSDRFNGTMLLDLIMLQMEKTFQAIRAIELKWKKVLDVKKETELSEMRQRHSAIAGFSHQVGHVIGGKSCFPLYKTRIEDYLTGSKGEGEIAARNAQILYAALLPRAFEDALDSEGAVLSRWEATSPDEQWITVSQFHEAVWFNLAKPLLDHVKLLVDQSPETTFRCAGLTLDLKQQHPFPVEFLVPNLEVVKVAYFESLWNAFEHGAFERQTGTATVTLSVEREPHAVTLVIQNPWKPENYDHSGRHGLGYTRAMIESLAKAGAMAKTGVRKYAARCKLESKADPQNLMWVGRLTLGGY